MTRPEDIPAVPLPGGAALPMVGIGTWQLHGEAGYRAVRYALEIGYRHIDTATMYGNEAEVGRAVRDSGVPRDQVFLTTKLPPANVGRERATLAASLRALGTEYVDLWLVHWPAGRDPLARTWAEFLKIRGDGLVREVGVSNYSTTQIDELTQSSGETPAVNQVPWSPHRYDAARLTESRQRGVVLEGYSPLKGSRLRSGVLSETAARYGVTPAQVVLRWHIEIGVPVIPKSAHPERIAQNLDLFGFSLTPQETARISAAAGG